MGEGEAGITARIAARLYGLHTEERKLEEEMSHIVQEIQSLQARYAKARDALIAVRSQIAVLEEMVKEEKTADK